mmetsp:Transcript_11087/g.44917  ORF Transcript_11087/g.44917 Transcript_11087/m.44917 type:complete len:202 (-) Transcript_11087:380-985(-)
MPRSARKQSSGARPVPSAFCEKYSFSANAGESTQMTPAIVSECPQKNLVAECTTMSAPSWSGFCNNGDMTVLSTSKRTPRCLQTSARPRKSQTRIMGFVGDSTITMEVAGVIAASKRLGPSGPSIATYLVEMPARAHTLARSRYVPPYESSESRISSPALARRVTALSAAMPVEKARHRAQPSASATARSNAVRVGLPDRV